MKNTFSSTVAFEKLSRKRKFVFISSMMLIFSSKMTFAAEDAVNNSIIIEKEKEAAAKKQAIKSKCELENNFKMYAVAACVKAAQAASEDKSTVNSGQVMRQ